MLLITICFSCVKIKFMYVCIFFIKIGEILFLFCLIEFYKEGKYDLDFKNPNSDPSKWVRTSSKFILLEIGSELAKSGFVLHVKYIIDSKEFLQKKL